MPESKPRVDTSKLRQKAEQAVTKHNFPYALELYQQILSLDPDDVESRKGLRALSIRNQQETGSSPMAVLLKNLISYIKLQFATKDPDKTLQDAEKYLAQDPSNYKVLMQLGEAAIQGGYIQTARWIFEDIVSRVRPKDIKALRKLQQMYREGGDLKKALEINQQILKIAPGDVEAARAVKDLQATSMSQRLTDQGVLDAERGKAARKVMREEKDYALARRKVSELRTQEEVETVIGYTKEEIEKNPENLQAHMKLGDLYLRNEDWNKAREAYQNAQELSPAQYSIKMRLQDVNIREKRSELRRAQAAYQKNPDDQNARAQYSKVYDEYLDLRRKAFEDRERNLPTELKIAYELGNIYYELAQRNKQKTGSWDDDLLDEAIARYQKTVKDPGVRTDSQLKLGQCFLYKGQLDLSIRQFTEAIDTVEFMGDQKKDLLYNRAQAFIAAGDNENAKKDLLTIYEVDIDYKDVADLVKKL